MKHDLGRTTSRTALLRAGFVVALALMSSATPSHAFKVTTWNLLDYPGLNLAGRQPLFRTVMQNLDTDVLMVQELKSAAGADSFLVNVLRVANPSKNWKNAGFLLSTESTIFYDSLKVAVVIGPTAIATGGPREVYQLVIRPQGYTAFAAQMRLYSVHFKAGNPSTSPADSTTRRLECTSLRTTLNNQSTLRPTILLGGDTNFYGDWESGYQRLLEDQLDDDGRLKDFYSLPGTWNQFAYRCHHSQCPCLSCPAGFSGGGLDDRFDFFLHSLPTQDGEGVDVINLDAYGNDCGHYNEAINQDNRNFEVPIAVANALHSASDHIPSIITLQLPAKVGAASQVDFGNVITGPPVETTTVIGDAAAVPADELTYTLTASAGFTAPSGTFEAAAGAFGNVHNLTMTASSPGAKTGTMTVNSDDPDSLAKTVLLSGRVIDHAAASVDSLVQTTVRTLDFSRSYAGGVRDTALRVHNAGWNAQRARLSVSNAVISGPDAARFSLVGGFSPSLVSGVAASLPLHFDATGTVSGQLYQATLTVSSADEPLPNAATQPDLVVTLRAYGPGTTDAPEALPTAVAFLPARPNPLSEGTMLRYELPRAMRISIEIYDLSGRRVATVEDGFREAGRHEVRWNAADDAGARVRSGLYFARFRSGGVESLQRLAVTP